MNPYYQDSHVTIYHGDCRELLPQLDKCPDCGSDNFSHNPLDDSDYICKDCSLWFNSFKVDLVLTDPPYRIPGGDIPIKGYGVAKRYKKPKTISEPWGFSLDWIELIKQLNPQHLVIHCNYHMIGETCYLVGHFMNLVCIFTWYKRNAPPSLRNVPKFDCELITWHKVEKATNKNASLFRSQLFDIPFLTAGCMATERIVNNNGESMHPTQKPIELIDKLILGISNVGDLILDPFLGSGTTCYCAKKLNRKSIGIEIEERYCEIAANRCRQTVMVL